VIAHGAPPGPIGARTVDRLDRPAEAVDRTPPGHLLARVDRVSSRVGGISWGRSGDRATLALDRIGRIS
jgi:hypothetical protein